MNLKKNPYFYTVPVVCLGLALALYVFHILWNSEEEAFELKFQLDAGNRISAVERELKSNLSLVKSLQAFYKGSEQVTRDEFHVYSQNILERHSSVQALEWIPRIPDGERYIYEERAREEGWASFQITERNDMGKLIKADQRDEYFPVYYVEPYQGNEAALGFDLASNPARLKALQLARDTNLMAVTARIRLVQEQDADQFGFLAFSPVYRKGNKRDGEDSLDWYRSNLQGFVLGVFRATDIVEKALSYLDPAGIDVYVYDKSAPLGERLIYYHASRAHQGPSGQIAEEEMDRLTGLYTAKLFEAAGRKWMILCIPTPQYLALRKFWLPWVVSVAIFFASLIIAWYLWISLTHSIVVERTVEERTAQLVKEVQERKQGEEALRESEEHTRLILETANDAFIQIDSRSVITYWNRQAEILFGWSSKEAAGKSLLETIIPSTYHEAHKKGLQHFLDTGEGPVLNKRVELKARHRDGHEFPIELTIWAVKTGESYQFNAFVHDISERKEAARKLQEAVEVKSEFTSMVSHELRTPLSVIKQGIDIVLDGTAGPVSSEQSDYLGNRLIEILRMKSELYPARF